MGERSVVQGAQRYTQQHGLAAPRQSFRSVIAHPDMTNRVANAYDSLPEHDKSAEGSFRAMREDTNRQFEFMTAARKHGGMGMNFEVSPHDPYPGVTGPADMMRDVRENNRIKVMSTATTGGHPFFSDEENDRFRGVHDVFGHAGTGRGFDRHGEEAAFLSHRTMFSPAARPALASETRGQNSSFIKNGDFGPQKIALLPRTLQLPVNPVVGRRTGGAAALQASQFHSQSFGVPLL